MIERRLGWATALAVWTLLVWATRIDNIWSDEALDTASKIGRTALAGSFVVLALLTLAWVWRHRHAGFPPCTVYLLGPFAAWTVVVWVVRGAGILVADHGAAFKVVHTALAAVSITLAVLASARPAR